MRAVGVKSYSAALWKFRLTSSRFLPRLAVSHGGAKLIDITAVCMTVTAVQGTRQVMRYLRNVQVMRYLRNVQVMRYLRNVGERARSPFAGNGGDRTQEVHFLGF
jgi:hypothetical protein